MLDEKQIPETVFKMASSTFVAEVEASTLAIMAPRLDEGSPYFQRLWCQAPSRSYH